MIIRNEVLIRINDKNRVQIIKLQLDYNEFGSVYSIYRINYQYGGKPKESPIIFINGNKGRQLATEKAGTLFATHLRKYLNNGYRRLSLLSRKPLEELNEEQLYKLLEGHVPSDINGVPKAMLAKSSEECCSSVFEKDLYVSRKLDGIRMLVYYKDGKIKTASRGGSNYDLITKHITTNLKIISLFEANPSLILDGELYKHGWPLQKIASFCHYKIRNQETEKLEYWIFDYISSEPFEQRLEQLRKWQLMFTEEDNIKIVDHYKAFGWLKIKKYHDQFVREGFEGLVARVPDKPYGIGKRSSNYMIKLKSYQDDEFEIVGTKEGVRDEDMCFILKTKDDKIFAAKPVGDVATRLNYLRHKDEYIGKFATCKFFYYSSDGIPQQPIFKFVRSKDDM